MIWRFLSAQFVTLSVIAFTSCSSRFVPEAMWPTAEERRTALAQYNDRWERDTDVKVFGLTRSIGIVKDEETATSKSTPIGMAALITRDGYAITANHVVASESPGVIASKNKDFFVPAHIRTLKFTIRGSDGRVQEQDEFGRFYATYDGEKQLLTNSVEIVIRPLRVVKRFKAIDLAIVKAEITVSIPFEFSEQPVEKGILFTSGNSFHKRGSTAGEVLRTRLKDGVGTSIHTSMPINPGHSGSPVFDEHGKLVGIATRGVPKGLVFLPRSFAARVEPDIIMKEIIKDRIENSKE